MIYYSLAHMSESGMEQKYVKVALKIFDNNVSLVEVGK